MNLDWKKLAWGGGILAAVLLIALLLRFFLGGTAPQTPDTSGTLPVGQVSTSAGGALTEEPPPLIVTDAPGVAPAVFKIAEGPVVSAVFIQAGRPTTTIARFASAADGHVYDLAIDSPGAVAQTVSNTTIPGIGRAAFRNDGRGVLMQFSASPLSIVRTVVIQFSASSSGSATVRFLPDNAQGAVFSPDGASIAYLKETPNGGAAGYVARADGSGERALFSFPLGSILLSWPSPGALLLTTKSATGAPGAAFSVSASSGTLVPLLFAPGLTTLGDPSFSHFLYQTNAGSGASSATRTLATSAERKLSFDPIPEKCAWFSASTLYCGVPLVRLPTDYLDVWHRGEYSAPDSILRYILPSGAATIVASPGASLGAEVPDIVGIGASPDGKYLFFITKESRTLWGVRLGR